MRIAWLSVGGERTLAVRSGDHLLSVAVLAPHLPRTLQGWLQAGEAARSALAARLVEASDLEAARIVSPFTFLPLVSEGSKVICLGLNYREHAAEAAYEAPQYPVIFTRLPSSLVGHQQPIEMPRVSTFLDYEAELAVVIGRRARHVTRARALEHVAGYTLFNDGSIRDWQKRTHQWTLGKNFDRTGPLGPELVTPDELPPGGQGLRISMRVNGETVQDANTRDMIFEVTETIATLSEAMALEPGDVIAMGTPSGVGAARNPPRFLAVGDVCEVEVERVGVLRNVVAPEDTAPSNVQRG